MTTLSPDTKAGLGALNALEIVATHAGMHSPRQLALAREVDAYKFSLQIGAITGTIPQDVPSYSESPEVMMAERVYQEKLAQQVGSVANKIFDDDKSASKKYWKLKEEIYISVYDYMIKMLTERGRVLGFY